MRITLEYCGAKITYEEDGDASTADQLKEIFSRMLVQATFSPEVIELEGGGRYKCEYVEGNDGN